MFYVKYICINNESEINSLTTNSPRCLQINSIDSISTTTIASIIIAKRSLTA